jgi:hypothetical protein
MAIAAGIGAIGGIVNAGLSLGGTLADVHQRDRQLQFQYGQLDFDKSQFNYQKGLNAQYLQALDKDGVPLAYVSGLYHPNTEYLGGGASRTVFTGNAEATPYKGSLAQNQLGLGFQTNSK